MTLLLKETAKSLLTTYDQRSETEFEALGVKFIATRDQVDLTTPAGRMFVHILESLGEFERTLIQERIMMGLDPPRQTSGSSAKK